MHFSDIPGHESIKQQLIDTVKEGRISHARLFLGPEGCGALALAVAYAQYISCENRGQTDSCGECASCRKYNKLIHPDLHFSYPFFAKHKDDTALSFIEEWRSAFINNPFLGIDEWRRQVEAENKQANINIAECHQILKKLSLKPFESEYKVLVMWLPEYLDKEGNTLLKIIEEPPQKTLFLLVAENQEHILNTIRSRTQLFKVPRFKDDDICHFLTNRRGVPVQSAEHIAYLSEGNIQTACNLINEENNNNFHFFKEWMRYCFTNRGIQAIDFSESISRTGRENQKNFLRYCMKMFREVIIMLSGAPMLVHLPDAEKDFIMNFSKSIDLQKAEALFAELEKAYYHIERNANPKILFLDVSLLFVRILKFNSFPKGTQYIYL